MNTKLIKSNFFLILFFFPLSYIIGIAIVELLILFYLFFLFINFSDKIFLNKKIIIILFLFSLYVGASAFLQIPSSLKYSSIFHFRYVLFSVSVFLFFEIYSHIKFNRKIIFLLLFSGIFVLIFDSFFQFLVGSNIFGQKLFQYRVSSFFGDDLILGSFLIRLLPIIIWYLFYLDFRIKLNSINLIAFFSLYFISVYLSGERTAFALLICQIFLFIIFIYDLKKILIISLINLSFFIIILAIFNFGKTDITNRMFLKTYNQITQIQKIQKKINLQEIEEKDVNFNLRLKSLKIFSRDHQEHIVLAKDLFMKNLVFGIGPKGFRHYCRTVNYNSNIGLCTTHPHNILAQILSELGLIGFLFYLVFIYYLIKITFTIKRNKIKNLQADSFIIIAIGLIVHMFPLLPSGNFFNNWISSFFYFKIGLLLFSHNKLLLK